MIFRPNFVFDSVSDISDLFLKKQKIQALLLDLDNTLTTHNNPHPAEKVTDWIEKMKQSGIKMMIVSNNSAERVKPFAEAMKLDFVSGGRKPLSVGFKKAQAILEIPFANIAVVGDQIFTDILGANLKKVCTIYVRPIELESGFFFKIKRFFEKPFIRNLISESE